MASTFDSVRDYIGALERRGRLLRLPEMDQDRYEATAFAYRLIERLGIEQAPAFSQRAVASLRPAHALQRKQRGKA